MDPIELEPKPKPELNPNFQVIGLMDPTTCQLPTVETVESVEVGKGSQMVIFKCKLTAQALCDRRVSIRYLLAGVHACILLLM